MLAIINDHGVQEETERLQAALAEREDALKQAQAKARVLESECSALRAAVEEAEAGCRDLQSRLAEAEVWPSTPPVPSMHFLWLAGGRQAVVIATTARLPATPSTAQPG